ncbi:hypothetical protein C2S53_008702 [Perilla frutescens var. hirtella]|uniref:Uncharacterized protein n=1 Tax=Perilla frutescens var. hirtella TaxID=608512 RepID=A0AAD4J1K1_PERFH|nr:hypothetical protein C2S53_008702 [Perilla frutescens var. hirtella]
MNAATSRNPTVRFSRMTEEYSYDADQARGGGRHNHGWRIFSTRRSSQNLMTSWSYKRDRARKRQIFLQTYKLGYASSGEKLLRSRKLKKMVVKVKSAVVSVLAFMRGGAFKSCNSRSAIPAASPARVVKFC